MTMCKYLLKSSQQISSINEPQHDKPNKMICVPSEDSDQPGHQPSLIRVFTCAQWEAKDPRLLQEDSEDYDQTGQMPRLIQVFAGRTGHFVGFALLWLNFKNTWMKKREKRQRIL